MAINYKWQFNFEVDSNNIIKQINYNYLGEEDTQINFAGVLYKSEITNRIITQEYLQENQINLNSNTVTKQEIIDICLNHLTPKNENTITENNLQSQIQSDIQKQINNNKTVIEPNFD
jgi:hypothetical protein